MNKHFILELIKQEGDKKEFMHRGFMCLIRRNTPTMNNLCGYVGIPSEMTSLYSKDFHDYDDFAGSYIPCHGGLTYSGFMSDYPGLWFIGFDCGHSGDLSPNEFMLDNFEMFGNAIYRDMNYVESELIRMVDFIYDNYPDAKMALRSKELKNLLE